MISFVVFFFIDKICFRGKPLIIVNVASQCGFTDTSYKEMKELADKYRDKGLSIAAFPCNQFGNEVYHFDNPLTKVQIVVPAFEIGAINQIKNF